MAVGCQFINCAIKRVGVEFCTDCRTGESCEKLQKHRKTGNERDSFKSYQKLEDDINFIKAKGIRTYNEQQRIRESLLIRILNEFNEGRSKSYYCIASTVMDVDELRSSLEEGTTKSKLLSIKEKSKMMHAMLDSIALRKGYRLSIRK